MTFLFGFYGVLFKFRRSFFRSFFEPYTVLLLAWQKLSKADRLFFTNRSASKNSFRYLLPLKAYRA